MIESGVTILLQDQTHNNKLCFLIDRFAQVVDKEEVASSFGRAKSLASSEGKLSYYINCDDIALYIRVSSFEVTPMWISVIKGWD